ncbi:VIT domain-containing protein [uncultured Lacinutrix sp.]|uniref:VIT domain-containing protein n=1 Tax=uncultured Lacinutrix sp. TaxID=574032 RepID=UPI00262F0837|nr:VIT domain-containing protein [uncultured Lacinutrix sp.]
MKNIPFIIFFLLVFKSFAQEIPQVKINDSTTLELKTLKVESEIIGNIATTSYTMKFYNGSNRILEGELAFPLGQGQAVTKFSMDVNGKMRDAVIVEKELGRIAYESTIRQRIDPGLLEVTKGNNYKARVYPIPAKGYKELRIEFEQELYCSNGKHIYEIPFNFNTALDFTFQMVIYGDKQKYNIIEGKNIGLKFKSQQGVHSAKVNKTNWIANTPFIIELPVNNDENIITYSNYFSLYKVLNAKTRLKQKPERITIFWDASYSMQYRDLDSEIKLLDKYFNYLDTVTVNFISFSNTIEKSKTFVVKNGNWKALKKEIKTIVYDGGTSYSKLYSKFGSHSNLNLTNIKTNEVLFFTDGMFNLGDLNTNFKTPIYTINTVNSANHEFLQNKAIELGGKYINLRLTGAKQALESLKQETYQFLGVKDNNLISEVYPRTRVNVNSDFSISGKFKESTPIELLFGYGNVTTDTIIVNINKSLQNKLAKRLWAKKKLNYLNKNKEENKKAIIKLAKKNHLITAYTSMIILDRIEDYVRYKIEPPKELRQDFKRRMEQIVEEDEDRLEDIKDRKNKLFEDYENLIKWYNTKYPIAIIKPKKDTTAIANITQPSSINQTNTTATSNNNITNQNPVSVVNNASNTNESTSIVNLDPNKRIVSGTILDEEGLPIPGVNIVISGTSKGSQTDFDGNYSINAETGDALSFSFIGYINKEVVVNTNDVINFNMEIDSTAIDEVVITAYRATKKESITASVTSVTSESITQTLQGQVAGIKINSGGVQPIANTNINLRGANSISGNTKPLYIVDGVPVSESDFRSINSNNIGSLSVLKDSATTAIYGNRGVNGAVVITTKEGLKKNGEQIQKLNEEIKEAVAFKQWTPDANYLKQLSTTKTVEEAYNLYLDIRKEYYNTPTFFIDVADFFEAKKEKALAIKIASNLAEIDLDNHEVLRALAYKLEYFRAYDLALYIYKEVLRLRPEEPQSTRDLALAHENVGDYQKAFDLLFKIINGDLVEKDLDERFDGIEHLAFIEAGHLYKLHKEKLILNETQKEIIKPITIGLRVVADWNHNNTDLDLYVNNPKEIAISYKNRSTNYGDRLSEDMTEGYGPEEYLIKDALKGEYEVELDYFSDEVQKISGPTIVKITIFKNYGKDNETKEIRIYRLEKEEDELQIGSITF